MSNSLFTYSGKSSESFAISGYFFTKHRSGPYPHSPFAIKSLVNYHLFPCFTVTSGKEHSVLITFEMSVKTRSDFHIILLID